MSIPRVLSPCPGFVFRGGVLCVLTPAPPPSRVWCPVPPSPVCSNCGSLSTSTCLRNGRTATLQPRPPPPRLSSPTLHRRGHHHATNSPSSLLGGEILHHLRRTQLPIALATPKGTEIHRDRVCHRPLGRHHPILAAQLPTNRLAHQQPRHTQRHHGTNTPAWSTRKIHRTDSLCQSRM